MSKLLIEVECGKPDHDECYACLMLEWPDGAGEPFCPVFKDRYGRAAILNVRGGKVYRNYACLAAEKRAKEKP